MPQSSAAVAALTSASSSSSRALSLYRALLRAARSLPSSGDREALEKETKQRFREERSAAAANGSSSTTVALARLFDEAEARLYDAVHHGIPYARLEHAQQLPRAVIDSAKGLAAADDGDGGNDGDKDENHSEPKIKLPRNASARRALEAALKRRAEKSKKSGI